MKANKIITTALLSSLALGVVASTPALAADPDPVKSGSSVEIGDGELDPEKDPKDPEIPTDPVIPDDVTPGKSGPLTILGVSNLRFGNVKSAAKDITKAANATTITEVTGFDSDDKPIAGTTKKNVGNYVQFGDIRTGKYGYTLKAELTGQFESSTGKELTNAKIVYTNPILTHEDAKTSGVVHPALEAGILGEMELTNDPLGLVSDEKEVIKFDGAAEGGKGIYSVEYGQSSNYDNKFTVGNTTSAPGTEGNSVFLKIPKATAINMAATTYTAEVTWTLMAQP